MGQILKMRAEIEKQSDFRAKHEVIGGAIVFISISICLAIFTLGYRFGRSTTDSLSRTTSSPVQTSSQSAIDSKKIERKLVLKPKPIQSLATSETQVSATTSQQKDESVLKPSQDSSSEFSSSTLTLSKGFESTIQSSKSILVSIIEMKSTPEHNYPTKVWSLLRSGSGTHLWIGKSKSDGILLRGTTLTHTHPTSVLNWFLEKDLVTGLEGIAQEIQILKSNFTPTGSVTLRRLQLRAGSLLSSKRDLLVVTSIECNEASGTITISTRSVPEDINLTEPKKNKNGFIRGKVYASGFILRSVRPTSITSESNSQSLSMTSTKIGTEIAFAIHADLLGSKNFKSDSIAATILKSTVKLQQGAAEGYSSSTIPRFMQLELNSFPSTSSSNSSPISSSSSPGTVSGSQSSLASRSMDSQSQSPDSEIDLSLDEKQELFSAAHTALAKLRQLHSSFIRQTAQPSTQDSPTSSSRSETHFVQEKWEPFYNQNGIVVRELNSNDSPIGILNASCSTDAPPHVVRQLLLEQPDVVDGLLEGRSILSKLDAQTYVQWLAYGAIWPVGARDFLLVTTEEPFDRKSGEGFMIVSTSIDNICEVDEEEGESGSEYARSCLKLAGYVGTPNASGGTDLNLFVDIDVYAYIPAWLLQVLAQYGLSEMMNRIRTATITGKFDPKSQKGDTIDLNKIINRIQTREAKMRQFAEIKGLPTTGVDLGSTLSLSLPTPSKPGPESSTTNKSEHETTPSTPTLATPPSPSPLSSSSSNVDDTSTPPVSTTTTISPVVDSEDPDLSATSTETLPLHPGPFSRQGAKLAKEALHLMRQYLGMVQPRPGDPLSLEWQVKVTKKDTTVSSSPVQGSIWGAVRGVTVIAANKHDILKLLTDDNRMHEYDDMFDTIKFIASIDDHTTVRRILFKAIWPTAPRDFLACTTWTEFPDGSIMIATRSAPDDLLAPQKGYVRGTINISGFFIQPHDIFQGKPSDGGPAVPPGSCRVTLTAHTELGGTLPASVINMLSTAAPMKMLSAISEILAVKR